MTALLQTVSGDLGGGKTWAFSCGASQVRDNTKTFVATNTLEEKLAVRQALNFVTLRVLQRGLKSQLYPSSSPCHSNFSTNCHGFT